MAIALRNAGHPAAEVGFWTIGFDAMYYPFAIQCDKELAQWQRDFNNTRQADPMRFELDWDIGMARMI